MTTTTRIYIDSTVTASRSLGRIPFPQDITALPSQIPGMILQFDVDGSVSSSLTRNRVGGAMTVIGNPAVSGYEVSLNESNYIDTGISITPYANSDMTFIGIAKDPGGKFNIVGVLQVAAPQRSRSHLFDSATAMGGRWLNVNGTALYSILSISAVNALPLDGIFSACRTVMNIGNGTIGVHADILATSQHALVAGGPSPAQNIVGNILIGGSLDHGTSVTGKVMAVLAFNRALTNDELSTVYRTYQNFYSVRGKAI